MKIWFINHYAVPPKYYPLARPSLFAKNLIKMGHDVTIIAASTVHNSNNKNLINGRERIKRIEDDGIQYVLINCMPYCNNGIKRVINILQFANRLHNVLDTLDKPDAIVATSFDPFTCLEGIKYAKRHGINAIAEIADLWPETLIEYTGVSSNNLLVRYLRRIEKKIYMDADDIIFTMEGAYKYILEQKWEEVIPESKVHYINNGILLERFDYNRANYAVDDLELKSNFLFKVVYTGSIRKVNNLSRLLEIAKCVKNENVRFLIWGDGDERHTLEQRAKMEVIDNVIFKGSVEKKYIPYIVSNADVNIMHSDATSIMRFGLSANKLFDYLAAGKPIIMDFDSFKNPIREHDCGTVVTDKTPFAIARVIDEYALMSKKRLDEKGRNARRVSEEYDFEKLTQKLIRIIKE